MAEDTRDNLSLSDDENDDEIEDGYHLPEMAGTLCKWTNYIHGWQDRYIVLKDGTLSYYKSETETSFGCRGAVSLGKALITPHEFDDCRFDVSVNDCLWYMRARNAEEKQQWIDFLDIHRQADSGYGSENGLRRHGSMLSLTSAASLSTASASSFKKGRGLREKLAEMETFRDILCRQVDTLQSYFDACASVIVTRTVHDLAIEDIDDPEDLEGLQKNGSPNGHTPPQSNGYPAPVHSNHHNHSNHLTNDKTQNFMDLEEDRDTKDIVNILQQHGAHAIDFKGESFTFKATTAGILATLGHCIDLMMQREDAWRKRLEKEVEKSKKIKEAYKSLLAGRPKTVIIGGPDFEEGPHSIMHEEEFFDAVDATLDKLDREEEKKKVKIAAKNERALAPPITSLEPSHPQYALINEAVNEHMMHADMSAIDICKSWMLIAEDGEMKVYKRELEEDGMVVDPLKAVHTVKGITGHELCHNFWDPSIRMDWEGTLDASTVIEWLSKDTVVTYQVHKRVWPATQRDSLFWSTIRHVPGENEDSPDYWCVVNHSTDQTEGPVSQGKCVRIKFNVAMICQTIVQPPQTGSDITRDSLTCKIQYSANVNPGGWAPASVIRVISKRELPKFLKTFTSFVQQKTKDQPIMF